MSIKSVEHWKTAWDVLSLFDILVTRHVPQLEKRHSLGCGDLSPVVYWNLGTKNECASTARQLSAGLKFSTFVFHNILSMCTHINLKQTSCFIHVLFRLTNAAQLKTGEMYPGLTNLHYCWHGVMVWGMFPWHTLIPFIGLNATAHLSIVADQVTLPIIYQLPMAASCMIVTQQKSSQTGLMNMTDWSGLKWALQSPDVMP